MTIATGVLFALVALISWGVGDFLIQRTSRLIGSAKALFCTGIVGFVCLTPFIFEQVLLLSAPEYGLLLTLSFIVIFSAISSFEALRLGKIATTEPVVGLELPLAALISILILGESITLIPLVLMVGVFAGTLLVVTRGLSHISTMFEPGMGLALLAALGSALTTVMVGITSQNLSPLIAIWFSHGVLAFVTFIYLIRTNTLRTLMSDIRTYPATITSQSIADNVAWVAFGSAVTLIPISVATTISGGYVALGVLLGLVVTHERVRSHQLLGIALVSLGIILLSYYFG